MQQLLAMCKFVNKAEERDRAGGSALHIYVVMSLLVLAMTDM